MSGRISRLTRMGKAGAADDDYDPTFAFILLFTLPICGLLAQFMYALKADLSATSIRKAYSRLNFADILAIGWYSIDAFTHLSIELGYLVLALTSTPMKSDTYTGWLWREYARADSRWAVRDPTVISIEILTVGLGFLCLLQVFGSFFKMPWRHPLQIIICVSELYGGWMTFCPEWVEGSPHLDGSDPILLWVYLVFMNGLWVVVPALLLWDSFARLTDIADVAKGRLDLPNLPKAGAPSKLWWQAAAGLIGLYMVLVPGILLSAEGVPVQK